MKIDIYNSPKIKRWNHQTITYPAPFCDILLLSAPEPKSCLLCHPNFWEIYLDTHAHPHTSTHVCHRKLIMKKIELTQDQTLRSTNYYIPWSCLLLSGTFSPVCYSPDCNQRTRKTNANIERELSLLTSYSRTKKVEERSIHAPNNQPEDKDYNIFCRYPTCLLCVSTWYICSFCFPSTMVTLTRKEKNIV